MKKRTALTTLACLMLLGAQAHADEGKDESGKGKQRYEERSQRGDRAGNSYFHRQGQTRIPNGHLPPPGECYPAVRYSSCRYYFWLTGRNYFLI